MTAPKDTKVAPNAFHGSSDADAGVLTRSVVKDREAEDIEESEDREVVRVERNEDIEPGP